MALLSEHAHGRDNNLNLIRAVPAVAVLVSDAMPIALAVLSWHWVERPALAFVNRPMRLTAQAQS